MRQREVEYRRRIEKLDVYGYKMRVPANQLTANVEKSTLELATAHQVNYFELFKQAYTHRVFNKPEDFRRYDMGSEKIRHNEFFRGLFESAKYHNSGEERTQEFCERLGVVADEGNKLDDKRGALKITNRYDLLAALFGALRRCLEKYRCNATDRMMASFEKHANIVIGWAINDVMELETWQIVPWSKKMRTFVKEITTPNFLLDNKGKFVRFGPPGGSRFQEAYNIARTCLSSSEFEKSAARGFVGPEPPALTGEFCLSYNLYTDGFSSIKKCKCEKSEALVLRTHRCVICHSQDCKMIDCKYLRSFMFVGGFNQQWRTSNHRKCTKIFLRKEKNNNNNNQDNKDNKKKPPRKRPNKPNKPKPSDSQESTQT